MQIIEFLFSVFGCQFFALCYSEKKVFGTFRCVIPTLKEYKKAQLVLTFPDLATHFSPEKTIFHSFI